MPVTAGTRISDGTVVWEVKDTRVVNDIDSANDNLDGLMSIEDFNKLTTLQNKYGPTGGPAGIDVIPSTSSVLTYDGSSKSPTWTNYNTALLTIGGQTSGINAGTYGATFTPTERYVWNDGSKAARTVYWTINKGSTTITTSEESVTISSVSDTTYEVSVSSNNTDGSITVQSSNTNVVTVTYNTSTNKVIIEMVGTGTANITINQAEGSNRLAGTKTIAVNVSLITTFAELTPAQIQTIVRQGKAAQYWNVGDLHAISFNGTINGTNTITLNDETLYCYIIGIDHNSEREGSNRLHLGLYKAAENDSYKQICLDAARMNSTNTNAGGWASCEMRTSRMPEVLATFPSAWQNVISNTTKYTDNTGGGVDDASYVTATFRSRIIRSTCCWK